MEASAINWSAVMSKLSQPHLHSEASAYEFVEAILWPHGPLCPRCGSLDRIGKLNGKSTRHGVYKCYSCRKPFRVTVGTIFEKSHIPLHKWLQAIGIFRRAAARMICMGKAERPHCHSGAVAVNFRGWP